MTNIRHGWLTEIRPAEGDKPMVFIIKDEKGEEHELYAKVGTMGTYLQLVMPPFEVSSQGDWGDGREEEKPITSVTSRDSAKRGTRVEA